MINKKLFGLVPSVKKYIFFNILYKVLAMITNILIVYLLSNFIYNIFLKITSIKIYVIYVILIIISIIIRSLVIKRSALYSYKISRDVKINIRNMIYNKIIEIGNTYKDYISTAEMVQITTEGVEQLEIYFANYLPQFFYSFIAPFILFIFLSQISLKVSFILLVCVPLIPLSIVIVQKIAKKIFGKYWKKYTKMGNSFLENLEGLTTLKIYNADEYKHKKMNKDAEEFRKATMRVLVMQLNSITVMDIVTFGGTALGMIFAIIEYKSGNISFVGTIMIILLSAEFFLPMRALGSFFHIAMNGIAVSDKIFKLLSVNVYENKVEIDEVKKIVFNNLAYSYVSDKKVLENINLNISSNGMFSIVGESGSGKSTIAKILIGINTNYIGNILFDDIELNTINRKSLNEQITLVESNSYIFKGSIRDNLLLGVGKYTKTNITQDKLFVEVLKKVGLFDFLNEAEGLNTMLEEGGTNFSGGQRQRLVLARALVANTPVFIFDEATSNIDANSEKIIIDVIKKLSKNKIIIFISHKLYNLIDSNKLYVLKNSKLIEEGTHNELMNLKGEYYNYYTSQLKLINMGGLNV